MFKIGDKVKLRNPSKYEWVGDAMGEVIRNTISDTIYIQWDVAVCIVCGDKDCDCKVTRRWYKPSNIKYVATKNQQLLFNFID